MGRTRFRRLAALGAAAALTVLGRPDATSAQGCTRPCVGPARGAILAAGGGNLNSAIYRRFVELAGGASARIVLIPTAGARDGSHDGWTAVEELKRAGVRRIEILHTRSRSVADLDAFVAPLREATGVWISGGRQYRLVGPYLGTRTHRELRAVLERGGIVGANSAGSSALASFLVRGGVAEDRAVMATGHDEGFGFLRGVAIDQHLIARGRENDLIRVLEAHPNLLGIGIDERAAVLITRDLAEVIGAGRVAVYDPTDPLSLIPMRLLSPGDVYDLGTRQPVLVEADRPGPPL